MAKKNAFLSKWKDKATTKVSGYFTKKRKQSKQKPIKF